MKFASFFKNRSTYVYFFFLILIAQRFFHLSGNIDEPNSWRQFDTFYYAYDFYMNGIHFFSPSVCWLGAHKVLILEFPLISALIAVLFKIFGVSMFAARTVMFIFYLGSGVYLYKLITYLYYKRIALLTLLIYLFLPLSVFYSRTIQIDFAVMFFSLAMLYYFIKGYDNSNLRYVIIGTAFAIFAFLIKSPYAFYMIIPLMYLVIKNKNLRFFFRTIPILAIPVIIFLFWQFYSVRINSQAPDWYFIPGYFKFNKMTEWYFGSVSQRMDFENWKNIFFIFTESITSYIGILFFISGLFLRLDNNRKKSFFYYYLIGLVIYLVIFFSLIRNHEYYQIPFLSASSFFIAVTIDFIYRKLVERRKTLAYVLIGFIIIVLAVNGIWFTERWYYRVDQVRLKSSEYIRDNSQEKDLIITSIDGTDPRDPRILAASLRNGWSIDLKDLKAPMIDSLVRYDAKYLAIITKENPDLSLSLPLSKYRFIETPIYRNEWKLFWFDLTKINR